MAQNCILGWCHLCIKNLVHDHLKFVHGDAWRGQAQLLIKLTKYPDVELDILEGFSVSFIQHFFIFYLTHTHPQKRVSVSHFNHLFLLIHLVCQSLELLRSLHQLSSHYNLSSWDNGLQNHPTAPNFMVEHSTSVDYFFLLPHVFYFCLFFICTGRGTGERSTESNCIHPRVRWAWP